MLDAHSKHSYAGGLKFVFRNDTFRWASLKIYYTSSPLLHVGFSSPRWDVFFIKYIMRWHHIGWDFFRSTLSLSLLCCVSIQFRVYKKMIFISGGCHVFINILMRYFLNNWLERARPRDVRKLNFIQYRNVLASGSLKMRAFIRGEIKVLLFASATFFFVPHRGNLP